MIANLFFSTAPDSQWVQAVVAHPDQLRLLRIVGLPLERVIAAWAKNMSPENKATPHSLVIQQKNYIASIFLSVRKQYEKTSHSQERLEELVCCGLPYLLPSFW